MSASGGVCYRSGSSAQRHAALQFCCLCTIQCRFARVHILLTEKEES